MKKILILIGMMVLMATGIYAFAGGTGTSGDPYQISDCTELQEMNSSFTSHYELINDIDCSDTINWNNGEGFIPIGYIEWDSVSGGIDGNGYTISDLYMNKTDGDAIALIIYIDGGEYYIRNIRFENPRIFDVNSEFQSVLISYVESGNNLTLENIVINNYELYGKGIIGTFFATGQEDSLADYFVARNLIANDGYITTNDGGLTGGGFGYLENSNTLIDNVSVNNVTIEVINPNVAKPLIGGLIGKAYVLYDFSINHVSATGQIISTGTYDPYDVGGLIGYLQFNAGNTNLNMTNVYSQIDLNTGNNSYNVGGIIGYIQNNVPSSENMEYVYYAGEINAGSNGIGGISGNTSSLITNKSTLFWDTELSGLSESDIGTGKTTIEMQTVSTWSAFDTDIWYIYEGYYPSFNPLCFPDWSCSGYEACVSPAATVACNETTDANACGESYTGIYSEFSTQACTYPSSSGSSSNKVVKICDSQGNCYLPGDAAPGGTQNMFQRLWTWLKSFWQGGGYP